MENLEKRLIVLIQQLGLNNAQFADAINVQRSSISHILSGRNKPSFDFLRKIFIKYPEINADWLIMGRGNIFENTTTLKDDLIVDKNRPVLNDSKQLFTEGQENVTDVTKKSLKSPENPSEDIEKVIILHTDGTFSEYNKRIE